MAARGQTTDKRYTVRPYGGKRLSGHVRSDEKPITTRLGLMGGRLTEIEGGGQLGGLDGSLFFR